MSTKPESLLLFSCNARLAHFLSEKFYNGHHYVWCGSIFNPRDLDELDPLKSIPTTSNPHDIYSSLKKECIDSDMHGYNIQRIRTGLMKGAGIKLASGIINNSQYGHIMGIIDKAQIKHFSPLLYIIPRGLVKSKLQIVPYENMASPLSEEYIIPDLTMNECEVINFINV